MTRRKLLYAARSCALVFDVVGIVLATVLAQHLRLTIDLFWDDNMVGGMLDTALATTRPLIVLGWIGLIALLGGYSARDFDTGAEMYRIVFNASLTAAGVTAMILFFTQFPMSRAYILILFLSGGVLLILERALARRLLHALYRRGIGVRKVLLIGRPSVLAPLLQRLRRHTWMGLRPIGVVGPTPEEAVALNIPAYASSAGLVNLAQACGADLILFASGSVPHTTDFRRYLWQFEGGHTELAVASSIADVASDRVRMRPVAGTQIVYVEGPRSAGALSTGKRAFDLVVGTIALILAAPVMAVTALAVKADGGPVLFRQTRLGKDGKPFVMLKFRSMVVDAEKQRDSLTEGHASNSVMFKLRKDPRITRVGSVIRRFSLDELPQIINILRGDMSIVGPRPPLPEEVAQYTYDEYRRLRVHPGLTGLWQVSGRSDLSWEETVQLDIYYIDNWSALQDLSILARTVRAVLFAKGAY